MPPKTRQHTLTQPKTTRHRMKTRQQIHQHKITLHPLKPRLQTPQPQLTHNPTNQLTHQTKLHPTNRNPITQHRNPRHIPHTNIRQQPQHRTTIPMTPHHRMPPQHLRHTPHTLKNHTPTTTNTPINTPTQRHTTRNIKHHHRQPIQQPTKPHRNPTKQIPTIHKPRQTSTNPLPTPTKPPTPHQLRPKPIRRLHMPRHHHITNTTIPQHKRMILHIPPITTTKLHTQHTTQTNRQPPRLTQRPNTRKPHHPRTNKTRHPGSRLQNHNNPQTGPASQQSTSHPTGNNPTERANTRALDTKNTADNRDPPTGLTPCNGPDGNTTPHPARGTTSTPNSGKNNSPPTPTDSKNKTTEKSAHRCHN